MKRIAMLFLVVVMLLSCAGCTDDCFGHETYTKAEEYHKIFELSEMRFDEEGFELFPETVDDLSVTDFYCEWELSFVGSAKVEIALSVYYDENGFNDEITRLKSVGDSKVVYDTENFKYNAYVSMLGYYNTSYYALVDEENNAIHYVMLQLIDAEDIDISKNYLPDDYVELGDVKNISYTIYE